MKKHKSKGTSSTPPVDEKVLMEHIGEEVNKEVLTLLQRPLYRLPTHKDLSRLIDRVYVYQESELIFENQYEKSQGIRTLIVTLANILDVEHVPRIIEQSEKFIVNGTNDVQTCVMDFFTSVDDLDNLSLRTLKLLKSCNQSTIAPALIHLQLALPREFGISDLRWSIAITFYKRHVVVTHIRTQAYIHGVFRWKFDVIHRLEDIEPLSTRITVTRVDGGNDAHKLIELIKPYYEEDMLNQVTKIFSKPWRNLPVAKDVPRFVHSLFISFEGEDIYDFETYQIELPTKLELLLSLLAKKFKPEIVELVKESTPNLTQSLLKDSNIVLRDYLETQLKLDDEDAFCRIMKFLTQSILAPFVTKLQLEMATQYPIKDGRLWKVKILENHETFEIVHTKDMVSLFPDNPFSFVWKVCLTLNKDVSKVLKVNSQVVSSEFKDKEQEKQVLSYISLIMCTHTNTI